MMQRCLFRTASSSSSIATSITRRCLHRTAATSQQKLNVEGLADLVNLKGQNVLMRVDLNVPLSKEDDVTVTDDTRLRAIAPTAKFLLEECKANVILCSHFGRPKGEIIEKGKNGRLNPVVKPLESILNTSVKKVDDCMGTEVEASAAALSSDGGQVMLLENTRFYAGETKNCPELSAGLGKLADYFVMDAFGTAHRAHSSTAGVTSHMKYSAAGYLLDKELKYLQGAVDEPNRPLTAIVGGAKVSTKIPVIESLLQKCDKVLVGGGMIFTFYKALGYDVGSSLVEDDIVDLAKSLLDKAKDKIVLPIDIVLADEFKAGARTKLVDANKIEDGWMGLDVGPSTMDLFKKELDISNTIVWNGPMGVFEIPEFAKGTVAIAEMLAEATSNRDAVTIVGGGDSVAAINQAGLGNKVSHISTGGGASLELLEGKVLPGVAALTDV